MALVLLLGGARSGKSTLAVRLAVAQDQPVTLLATAEPGDEEMAAKIAAHRAERPAGWTTVEEPLEVERAVAAVDGGACLIIDCLTLWVANLLQAGCDDVADVARAAALVAATRPGPTIAVTNEVGSGVVPAAPATRQYRDTLGTVNAVWAAAAERAALVVAGRVLPLAPPETLIGG